MGVLIILGAVMLLAIYGSVGDPSCPHDLAIEWDLQLATLRGADNFHTLEKRSPDSGPHGLNNVSMVISFITLLRSWEIFEGEKMIVQEQLHKPKL